VDDLVDGPVPDAMTIDVDPAARRHEAMVIDETLKAEMEMAHADQMVLRNHVENQTAAVALKAEITTARVDRMVRRSDVMTIDEVRLTNATVVVIEVPAALRTWIETVDHRKPARQKAVTNPAVQEKENREAASLARAVDHRLARARAGGHSDLRCEADDLLSLAAVLADRRGHNVVEARVAEMAAHHLAEALREWDHRGCNAVNHLAVDDRSATADQDVLRWGHRG
jgi:hypothetical protein